MVVSIVVKAASVLVCFECVLNRKLGSVATGPAESNEGLNTR